VGGVVQPSTDPYLTGFQPASAGKLKPSTPDLETSPHEAVANPDSGLSHGQTTARSTIHPSPLNRSVRPDDSAPNLAVTLEPPIALPSGSAPKIAAGTPVDSASVLAMSRAKLNTLSSYQVRLNRQERVGERLQPAEDVILSLRRQPTAVRLEWPSGPHKGREVIYSAADPSGMMYVNAADSIVPVPRLSLPPDSPLVMRNSRHPITQAGFDPILLHIEKDLASKDPGAKSEYEGIEIPPAVGRPCHKLTHQTRAGERWVVYIDTRTAFPTIVEATDSAGNLLERYIFSDVAVNPVELASNDAFDPDRRWGASTGFLGRLARSGGRDARSTAATTR